MEKLGVPCKNKSDCKAPSNDQGTYGDLTCNPNTNRCEFKACDEICSANPTGSRDDNCQESAAGGPCARSQNDGNKKCANTKFKGDLGYTVATGDNPKMFPAYILDSYGSCSMNNGQCGEGTLQGKCYDKRIEE